MGVAQRFIQWLIGKNHDALPVTAEPASKQEFAAQSVTAYDTTNFTFSGSIAGYDYDAILRDKQSNIQSLFQQADYFTDADPLFKGIVKGVYTPFSIAKGWEQVGGNEQSIRRYQEYYDQIHLDDKLRSIFLQYYKYGNVYLYLMEDGNLISMPVHKMRISNITLNGEPVVEFDTTSIRNLVSAGQQAQKDFIDDVLLEERLKGFPPEVGEAIRSGTSAQWIQLNPANTFVLQDLKEEWLRYAIPMVSACLQAFSKKAMISNYENSQLNMGAKSFQQVQYGDEDGRFVPSFDILSSLKSIYQSALKGGSIAVVDRLADSKFVQADTQELFNADKYAEVNAEILSAGGIASVVVSGRSDEGSSFASAQVSIQTAAMRIKQAQENVAEMMNRINQRLNGIIPRRSAKNVPVFRFIETDLSGDSAFKEACMKLWTQGTVSTQTLLDAYGLNIEQETARRKEEASNGTDAVLAPREEELPLENDGGRPSVSDAERTSDLNNAKTGAQPKPSNPDGSL